MMEIDLRNVGIVRSAHLTFVCGLNLIIGPSSSGKSTLLRALRAFIGNSFTDSNITYGEKRLAMKVAYNGHTAIYVRDLDNPQRKSAYQVDGKVYTKVGRNALDPIEEAFGLGPVEIGQEKIAFNFSSQFSGPFLLLGSPSLLYSILTYRTTFDVSQINALYFQDLKQAQADLSSVERSIGELSKELERKEQEASRLADAPMIYQRAQELKERQSEAEIMRGYVAGVEEAGCVRKRLSRIEEVSSAFERIASVYSQCAALAGYIRVARALSKASHAISCIKSCDTGAAIAQITALSLYCKKVERKRRGEHLLTLFKAESTETLDLLARYIVALRKAEASAHEISSLSVAISEAETCIKDVGVCPLCGSKLGG